MRYTVTRLCGGKALMVSPDEDLGLDMAKVSEKASGFGDLKQSDDAMAVFRWDGMEVTVYTQGKIMFFPLSDRDSAIRRAGELLDVFR